MEEFFNRTKICYGSGALDCLKDFQAARCFVVADPFLVESGMIERITKMLNEHFIFHKVMPDPTLELVVEGIRELEEYGPEVVIASGGGSAIDEAKAILHFGRRIAEGKTGSLTFAAIPTTSGTGSEVTSFAVITDQEKGMKYPLVDAGMRPDLAILDPSLVRSVPRAIAADTGMDVLTHGLEAYVSSRATPFTDALAEKAIELVFRYLPASCAGEGQSRGQEGAFAQAREQLHYASCIAGMAFDAASLGINHAVAHNIGGKFHVPHGRANAVLLPHTVGFNAKLSDYNQKDFSPAAQKYAGLAGKLGFGGMSVRTSVKNLMHQIKKLQKELSMPEHFRDCGVSPEAYQAAMEDLITGALEDACMATNPRPADRQDVELLLKLAL